MSEREKNRELALKFLKNNKTVVLATASKSCEPQAATVFYAIDDDFTFNFLTNNKSRKFKNLKENPHVAIVVGGGPDIMTIQCGGHAEIIDYGRDTSRAQEVSSRVMANIRLGGEPPELPVLLYPDAEVVPFTVKPSWMVMLNLEYKKDPEGYKHEYLKVLP